jgi:two-component system chemotaxis sensor kinase CheA
MDVVRANVEKVGGSVEVESRRGEGTTLRLRVPLTLAIVPSLVVRSGGQSFALPQSALVELVDIPQREFARMVQQIGSAELFRLRERLLPMVWLDRLLGLESERPEESQGHYLAVLEADGCRYGLVVDDLMSPEEIVVKPLSPVLREIGLFSGATVLGNGTLALILDVGATAARAGVKPIEDEGVAMGAGETAVQETAGESFLIFEDRIRERTALPLDVVERIESVPLERIEYACGRALLQYRGELLPLKDHGHVLESLETARERGEEVLATVLICGDERLGGEQRVGMIVRQVLDVSTGTMLERETAGDEMGMELVLVKEKLTQVRREFDAKTASAWQEVA